MSISGINQTLSRASEPAQKDGKTLGKNEFLSLLVAQLEHQDPMNPMDSTGFTAQLAQFSSLEQLQNVNEGLSKLGNTQSTMSNSQAVGYIGKTVTALGDGLQVDDGSADEIRFNLKGDAAAVFVNIYDGTGNFVRNIELGAMSAGNQGIEWDGMDQTGNAVPNGRYSFEVLAMDAQEEKISVDMYTSGEVTGVTFKNGEAYLSAGNLEIPVSKVIRVTSTENL